MTKPIVERTKSAGLENIMINNQTKSKQRIADHGEVFTAEREVNAMLDLVKQKIVVMRF